MTTFQARRLKLYFSNKKRKHYPHTLNGSGLAVQRVLVSLLENSLLGCYKEVKIPCIMKYKYVYKNIGL
jgi:seryl-tRNA synthetase